MLKSSVMRDLIHIFFGPLDFGIKIRISLIQIFLWICDPPQFVSLLVQKGGWGGPHMLFKCVEPLTDQGSLLLQDLISS